MLNPETGFIGGSSLYSLEGAKVIDEFYPDTPWGKPSDAITIAEINGRQAAFLPRHGRGHRLLPSEVNSRANIAALKMAGVQELFAFSAVGSLKEDIRPRDFIVPSQLIDRTKGRQSTFFGGGIVAHIAFADPFCLRLSKTAVEAINSMGISCRTGETLVCMEGPAFSTRAESGMYRAMGAGLINMSALPEAKLAREAEICYCMICMCTDYDCWREAEEDVSVDMLLDNLNANASRGQALIKTLMSMPRESRTCSCPTASAAAVMTAPEAQPAEARARLATILPKYFAP